jgi:hypothetical protein
LLKNQRVGKGKARRVIQFSRLFADGFHDFRVVVARVHAPQARRGVQQFAAVIGIIIHAFRAFDHPRLFLEGMLRGKGHEMGIEIVGLQSGGHGFHPSSKEGAVRRYRLSGVAPDFFAAAAVR